MSGDCAVSGGTGGNNGGESCVDTCWNTAPGELSPGTVDTCCRVAPLKGFVGSVVCEIDVTCTGGGILGGGNGG